MKPTQLRILVLLFGIIFLVGGLFASSLLLGVILYLVGAGLVGLFLIAII